MNFLLILLACLVALHPYVASADYMAWSASTGATSPGRDSDQDGLAEVVEYACLTNPLAAQEDPFSGDVVLHTNPMGRHLHISFPRRTDVSDLTYEVRVSESFQGLDDGGSHTVIYRYKDGVTTFSENVVSVDNGTTPPTVEVADPIAMTGQVHRFMRVVYLLDEFVEFVPVGDAGNASNPARQNLGAVAYDFDMGKFEVTNAQYTEFLNAVASDDPNGIYDPIMGGPSRGGIIRSGSAPNFTYTVKPNLGDKPVIYVTFWDVCRFCNWLHNGRPQGSQTSVTTENGAYDLTVPNAIANNTVVRTAGARYFIPNRDEWVKASFFDPAKNGTGGYWTFATMSDILPTKASSDAVGNINNGISNVANYNDPPANSDVVWGDQAGTGIPYTGHVTTVGSAGAGSASYYGAHDMAGNVWEWIENNFGSIRNTLGGSWSDIGLTFTSTSETAPGVFTDRLGFRIARP